MPFSLESLQQRWRHECRRVDGVPVARRCTASRCWMRSCSQVSPRPAIARQCRQQQRRMSSDYNEWPSPGRDGCKCAAFHGVLVQIAYVMLVWLSQPTGLRRGPSLAGSIRKQTSATHAKTIARGGNPARHLLQRRQTRAASRAPTAARRQRPHLETAYRSPPRYRRAAAAARRPHNSQRQRSPSKRQP